MKGRKQEGRKRNLERTTSKKRFPSTARLKTPVGFEPKCV